MTTKRILAARLALGPAGIAALASSPAWAERRRQTGQRAGYRTAIGGVR